MNFKIGGSNPMPGISNYNSIQKAAPTRTVSSPDTDKIDISASARSFDIAFQAVKSSPDVRMDKVAAIQEAVKTGNYSIDTQAAADKIIAEAK